MLTLIFAVAVARMEPESLRKSDVHQTLFRAATKGVLHDCLEFRNGLPFGSVLSWKMMEYMPFRRMDLRPDGSWKAISFPLPRGEVRDMPEDALIHHSAILRMEANEGYRYVYISPRCLPHLYHSSSPDIFREYHTHGTLSCESLSSQFRCTDLRALKTR